MKDKCINCENIYHSKDDTCRRCKLEEVKRNFINELAETKVYKLMIRILDWLDNVLSKMKC